jgi:hypothetical protein
MVFALIFAEDAAADEAATSPDGRFNTLCDAPGTPAAAQICEVPFARLIATPERFDGRVVMVTGYLILSANALVLFPDKESFDASLDVEGIDLGAFAWKNRNKARRGLWPVTVSGRFDARYLGAGGIPRLGRLTEIKGIVFNPPPNKTGPDEGGGPPATTPAP